jgi:hypothetical protein
VSKEYRVSFYSPQMAQIAQILIACGVSTIPQIGVFEICGIVLVMTSQESV